MKNKLLSLPLFTLIFSGCAASVTVDQLPELVSPPTYLSTIKTKMSLEYNNYLFPGSDYFVNGEGSSNLSVAMYDNYVAITQSSSAYFSLENTTLFEDSLVNSNSSYYIFNKGGYTYELSHYKEVMDGETDEEKSGEKTAQSTAEFETYMKKISEDMVDSYWGSVTSIYEDAIEMDVNDLNEEFIFEFAEGFSFTKQGDVYTAMAEGHHDDYGVIKLVLSFTVKSGVITKCVSESSIIKNNIVTARATEEISLTFVDKLKNYSGKLPNINDYDFD